MNLLYIPSLWEKDIRQHSLYVNTALHYCEISKNERVVSIADNIVPNPWVLCILLGLDETLYKLNHIITTKIDYYKLCTLSHFLGFSDSYLFYILSRYKHIFVDDSSISVASYWCFKFYDYTYSGHALLSMIGLKGYDMSIYDLKYVSISDYKKRIRTLICSDMRYSASYLPDMHLRRGCDCMRCETCTPYVLDDITFSIMQLYTSNTEPRRESFGQHSFCFLCRSY